MAKRSWAKNDNKRLRIIRVEPEIHEAVKIAAHEALLPMKVWVDQALRKSLPDRFID